MKWNLDDVMNYVSENGGEVGVDNDGQIVIYTNLRENAEGELEVMGDINV
jgi:hypothetical protein